MRRYVVALGLASEAELDELDAAARAHFDRPDTVLMPGLFFLVSVRKRVASGTGPATA